jgi:hypothetical protein
VKIFGNHQKSYSVVEQLSADLRMAQHGRHEIQSQQQQFMRTLEAGTLGFVRDNNSVFKHRVVKTATKARERRTPENKTKGAAKQDRSRK